MIEGTEHDDKYRMVEDELLAVAGSFTAHLHAAEYQRLKALAKNQNAETIDNISRPVTGDMTDAVRRRHEEVERAARQHRALKRTMVDLNDAETDDYESPRTKTFLQGLMNSPRKKAAPLTSFTTTQTATRAAAGLGRITSSTRASNGLRPVKKEQSSTTARLPNCSATPEVEPVQDQPKQYLDIAGDDNSDGPDDGEFLRMVRERRAQKRTRRPAPTSNTNPKNGNGTPSDIIPSFL